MLAVLPLFVASYCIYFLSHSYSELSDDFRKLNPCFYRSWNWQNAFFTEKTKAAGNVFCYIGILVSVSLSAYAVRTFRKNRGPKSMHFTLFREDAVCLAILFAILISQWIYGFRTSYPAFDEVFSAVNCSGMHPFQTASYYMLPNNHVFFNLLNHFLGASPDARLISGRIVSGTAFAALLPFLFYWLKEKCNSRFFAVLFCALMLLQFPVWGFSFQARGYSITLFCAWVSLISLEKYLRTHSHPSLWVHTFCVIVGLWTIPTFLFWELALLVFFLGWMVYSRRIYWAGIQAQLVAGAAVFLVYLPVLCFSGAKSIFENGYVVSEKQSLIAFWPKFKELFQATIQYCYSGSVDAKNLSYLILFFTPFILFPVLRKTRIASTLGFLLALWIVFVGMESYIQRFPFMRNLNAHVSFSLAALLLSLLVLMERFAGQRLRWLQAATAFCFCMAMGLHFLKFNRDHVGDCLYFYQADVRFKNLDGSAAEFPPNTRVWVSDEGFFWEYLLRSRGSEASMCFDRSNASFYIKNESEKLPASLEGNVEMLRKTEDYEIYRIVGR